MSTAASKATGVPSGVGTRGAASGRPAGAASARRRKPAAASAAAGGQESSTGAPGATQTISQRETLRFYTDDASGLKIGPTTVLILSVSFIGFVILLHIWGKMTRGPAAPSA